MKIVLVSDNHHDEKVIQHILETHPDADLYLHCGDSQMSPHALHPFQSVKGNNDYFENFPKQRIMKINDEIQLMIVHGDRMGYFDLEQQLVRLAKKNHCQIICSGHTHVPSDRLVDGIRLLNPGSTSYPRSMIGRTYMVLTIEGQTVDVTLVKISK